MKSKEDCLSEATGIGIEDLRFKNEVEIVRPSEAYEAMDSYAKQEAIAFINWTLLAECEYSCTDEDQWTHQDILENGIAQNITTEQLYNLYLESKKQKV